MKKHLKLIGTAALSLLIGSVAVAQEHDDVYFTPQDRVQANFASIPNVVMPSNPSSMGGLQSDPMRSKFANPDFQPEAKVANINLPYYRKDYNTTHSFNGLYRNPHNLSFFNGWNTGMGMMAFNGMGGFGFSPWGGGMWNDPWMMNGFGWGAGWGSPWMMNRFGWNDPWMMNGFGWGWNSPMMMNGFGWGAGWGSPWMMNRFGWGGGWNRPVFLVQEVRNVNYGPRPDRSNVSNANIRPRADEYVRGGRTEAGRSSQYGNYNNSSVSRSAYNTSSDGRSTYTNPNSTGRSSNYYQRSGTGSNNNNSPIYNSSGRSTSSPTYSTGGSYGGGSFGGGAAPRSTGGRGGRGN